MNSKKFTLLEESVQTVVDALADLQSAGSTPIELRPWIDLVAGEGLGAGKRKRSLSPEDMMWLVVGMGVFRNVAINDVAKFLGIAGDGGTFAASSSLTSARQRVGVEPLQRLFNLLVENWAVPAVDSDSWKGLGVYAMDGTTLSVPDTDENFEHFGKPSSRDGDAGYPKLRMVMLVAVRSQMLLAMNHAPYTGKGTGEQTLASPFWNVLPQKSVLLFDRGFNHIGRMALYGTLVTQRYFVTRERSNFVFEQTERLNASEQLVRCRVPDAERTADSRLPEFLVLRRIKYQFPGHPPSWLLTTLLDHVLYPASEVVALYHERWAIELAYRDIKTTQLQKLVSLRSKTPEGIHQELLGILVAYQLVRKRMYDVAERNQVEPNRLSFKTSLLAVQLLCLQLNTSFAAAAQLTMAIQLCDAMIYSGYMGPKKLRPSYDRAVKVKMSKYKRNRGKRGASGSDQSPKTEEKQNATH